MDIILNTKFNNPNLPVATLPGFTDSFDRAAADTLGMTDDRKPWHVIDSGSSTSTWGTYGDGTAGMKDSSSKFHAAVADGLAANGTLTATLATYEAATRRPGLAIRATDSNNMIYIAQASASAHALRLANRVGGQTTTLPESGPELVAGDTLKVEFNGPTITVRVNGTTAFTVNIADNLSATSHGLYAFTGALGAWESIEFTPAA